MSQRLCGCGLVLSFHCWSTFRQFNQSLTVKLLDGPLVIQSQLEVVHVIHSTLVVWPHDGRISGGMGQAQCVAKLVHCYCEQVCGVRVT